MHSFPAALLLSAALAFPVAAQAIEPDDPVYLDVRKAQEAMFDRDAFPMWPATTIDIENHTFDLIHCGDTGSAPDSAGRRLEAIAHWVTYWRRNFTTIGFPETLWQPLLDDLEKEALASPSGESNGRIDHEGNRILILQRETLAPLVTALNRYRAEKAPDLPPVVADGPCGDEADQQRDG